MILKLKRRNSLNQPKKPFDQELCFDWLNHSAKIILCSAFIVVAFVLLIWPQIKVNLLYASTRCLVLGSQLGPLSKVERFASFQPKFLTMYAVKDKIYTQWAYDTLNNLVTNPKAAKAITQEIKLNQYYRCWYDPKKPHKVILKRGWDRISLVFFAMTLLVLGITLRQFRRWYFKRK